MNRFAEIVERIAVSILHPDKLIEFPEFHQIYDFDCGASALQSVITYYGGTVREQKIMEHADTTEKDGTDAPGMLKALRYYGLKYKDGSMTIEDLKGYIDKDIPVIIIIQAYDGKPPKTWKGKEDHSHWVVAIGYKGNKIIFEDPDAAFRTYVEEKDLMDRWYDYNSEPHYYGIAVFGKPMFKTDLILPIKRSETEAEGRMEKLKKAGMIYGSTIKIVAIYPGENPVNPSMFYYVDLNTGKVWFTRNRSKGVLITETLDEFLEKVKGNRVRAVLVES